MQIPGPSRILLIEDEATTREISRLILEGAGYEVDAVDCAVAAHERLSLARYRLVIADWLLPNGDGIYLAGSATILWSSASPTPSDRRSGK